jgi:Histidine kinase-, DNA gyrase B-, and HSP90-like ATPase
MASDIDGGKLALASSERLVLPPDPVRMIEGLRDTGYKITTAIADLIDNSIAANALNVDVSMDMADTGEITLCIVDDGVGMNREALTLAMTYGSPVRPDAASLGRFGLGLKTASTAFCRRLSVISRSSGDDAFVKATWDLDHVARVKSWELLVSEANNAELEKLKGLAGARSGTLVVWEKVDRLLKTYQDPTGSYARTALERQLRVLSHHLSMVYQRYLDPADKRTSHKVQLTLQGQRVESWDPFVVGESDLVASERVVVDLEGRRPGAFTVRAYVLPRKEDFSETERAEAARPSVPT